VGITIWDGCANARYTHGRKSSYNCHIPQMETPDEMGKDGVGPNGTNG
jgi:hypothetical protein